MKSRTCTQRYATFGLQTVAEYRDRSLCNTEFNEYLVALVIEIVSVNHRVILFLLIRKSFYL